MPHSDTENNGIEEVLHEIVRRLSSHLNGTRVMVFLIGREVFGDWVIEGGSEAHSDRIVGVVLLEQSHHGKKYCQFHVDNRILLSLRFLQCVPTID